MFASPDGNDVTTTLADLTQPQRDLVRQRLSADGIDSRWTGFELTIDGAWEERAISIIGEVRATPPQPLGGPAPGGSGAPGVASAADAPTAPAAAYGQTTYGQPGYGPPPGTNAPGGYPAQPYPPQPYPPQPYPPGAYPPGAGAYPQPAYPQPAYGYSYPPMPTNNQNAVIALVLSIVAWVACPIIPAIVAIVMGNNAKREITASGGMQTGDGMAKAAVIISWIHLGLYGVAILFYVVIIIAALGSSAL